MSKRVIIIIAISFAMPVVITAYFIAQIWLRAQKTEREILNSFEILDNGLIKTNENINRKNNTLISIFDSANNSNQSDTVRMLYDKAQNVRRLSTNMFNHLEVIKIQIITSIEKNPDNKDSTTNSFFFGKDSIGKELKNKIECFRDSLMLNFPERLRANLRIGLETKDVYNQALEYSESWERTNFYQTPAVASIAILTKFQNDIRNIEADAITLLYNAIPVNSGK